MKSSLDKSEGARRLSIRALMVCFTGLHSALHPAMRVHWKQRHLIRKQLSVVITDNIKEIAIANLFPFKECVRRLLRHTLTSDIATRVNMCDVPSKNQQRDLFVDEGKTACLYNSMSCFAVAGNKFTQKPLVECSKGESLQRLNHILALEFKIQVHSQATPKAIKLETTIHQKVPATDIAFKIWDSAFKTNFIPLWVHGKQMSTLNPKHDSAEFMSLETTVHPSMSIYNDCQVVHTRLD